MKLREPTTDSFPPDPGEIPVAADRPWRDVALVALATALLTTLAIRFQWSERLYAVSRLWESLQLDELALALLLLSVGLMWLAWRRFAHARRALRARQFAERRLAQVLADNRRLAQEQLRIQENERKHLARELHDELGQYLQAIKLDALTIAENDEEAPARGAADAIVRSVDHLHEVVGAMIARLRPVALDELGLSAAIEHCVDVWRQRLTHTRFEVSIEGGFDDLEESLAVTVYRVIQEALTNVYKHAGAARVELRLRRVDSALLAGREELQLMVTDDGRGMRADPRPPRFGLSGMRERVELAGGRFQLHSAPGEGVRIDAHLPLTVAS